MPVRSALLAGFLLLAGARSAEATPVDGTPSAPAAPAAPAPPAQALRHLQDLRVYLDYDDDTATFATWPLDKFGARLPPDQIARAVRLGLALWASVLPDLRFRFVARPGEANMAVRFGPYARSGFGQDGGRAWLPEAWDSLRLDCGRFREARFPDGRPCEETAGNIVLIHERRWAVKAADLMDPGSVAENLAWVFDTARAHHKGAGTACRDARGGSAAWTPECVEFARAPRYAALAGLDLPSIIQHEFGHALMGHHADPPYECVEYARRPVFRPDLGVRLAGGSFSVMYPGNGVDGWWNRRGVFPADAGRLRDLGYRVSYPAAAGTVVLARRDGARRETRDWEEAVRLLGWPLEAALPPAAQGGRRYYVVDVRPDFGAVPAEPPARGAAPAGAVTPPAARSP